MPVTYRPDQRRELEEDLHRLLNATALQALRGIARQWGWPVRGTAKAEVVEQVLACLGDTARMAAAARQLTDDEREILGWLSAMRLTNSPEKALQTALEQSSGRQVTQKAISEILRRLGERGLTFFSQYRGYEVPGLYREWLPALAVPGLLPPVAPDASSDFSLTVLNQHVQHLLAAVEADRPAATVRPATGLYPPTRPSGNVITPALGLVDTETLIRWGYLTDDERHLARFLLEQLTTGGVCQVEAAQPRRLVVVADALRAWVELTAAQRLNRLREWWVLTFQQTRLRAAGSWSEIDLALHDSGPYQLRAAYYYAPAEQPQRQIAILRAWLLGMMQCWPTATWISIERLGNLLYHLHRDLLSWDANPASWRWHRGDTLLDPQQMDFDAWMHTYGRLLIALLTGPATWLAFVQVGSAGGKPVAFRYLDEVTEGRATDVPADALSFPAADVAVLRNTWQTGELRQLIQQIALERDRDPSRTTYRLDTVAFRRTLQAGSSAPQITACFAAAGFPLPKATQQILQGWQDRAGQYHLYDNLAVVEFNQDIYPEELRAITGLAAGQFRAVSPRCLIVLNPETIPALIDALRRRGYTPRVLP